MSSTTSRKVGGSGQPDATGHTGEGSSGGMGAKLAFAWTFVGVPLAYGIYETAKKAAALFTG
jgi:hypothetical protein